MITELPFLFAIIVFTYEYDTPDKDTTDSSLLVQVTFLFEASEGRIEADTDRVSPTYKSKL